VIALLRQTAALLLNLVAAGLLITARRVPMGLLQCMVFAMTLLDGVFILSVMTLVGGLESMYWLFTIMFVRAAFSVPRLGSQILLTLTLIACYAFACVVEKALAAHNLGAVAMPLFAEPEGQPIVLPLVLLISVAACCYGMQILLHRNQSRLKPVAD